MRNQFFNRKEIRFSESPLNGGYEMYIIGEDGEKQFCAQLEYKEIEPGHIVDETTILHYDEAQQLMNELWRLGLRPTGNYKQDTQASKKHLDDMRRIAFTELAIDLPEDL